MNFEFFLILYANQNLSLRFNIQLSHLIVNSNKDMRAKFVPRLFYCSEPVDIAHPGIIV